MKKEFVYIWIFIIGVFISNPLISQNSETDTLRVLFVGNSYTYFWNLPQTVEAMAHSQDFPLIARKSTAGGTNWKQHWEGDKGLQTRELIQNGNWDVVILQNHSKSTIEDLDQFNDYGNKLIQLGKESGAKVVLYETWARGYNPLMIDAIKNGYHSLAESHQVDVVHIGEIWQKALALRPDLRLYDPDNSHPSTIGTYLIACAFYSYLSDKDSKGLDKRISKLDEDQELLYLSIMSEDNAAFLQEVVDSFNKGRANE